MIIAIILLSFLPLLATAQTIVSIAPGAEIWVMENETFNIWRANSLQKNSTEQTATIFIEFKRLLRESPRQLWAYCPLCLHIYILPPDFCSIIQSGR